MSPTISVIVCTFNRPKELRRVLESLVQQSLEQSLFEIIVVDNSTEQRARAVTQLFQSNKNIRYVNEPILGLSHSRNTGVHNARGELVAFIDDDAAADRLWLSNLLSVWNTTRVDCLGGAVDIVLEVEKPAWLADELLFCLGYLSISSKLAELKTGEYLHGVNIAFSKKRLLQCGGFNTALGRRGASLISGEEVAIQKKIRRSGGVCLYEPQALVHHYVSKERLTKDWFRKRLFYEGISLARLRASDEAFPIWKRPLMAVMEFIVALRRLIGWYLSKTKDEKNSFKERCYISRDLGYVVGLLGLGT